MVSISFIHTIECLAHILYAVLSHTFWFLPEWKQSLRSWGKAPGQVLLPFMDRRSQSGVCALVSRRSASLQELRETSWKCLSKKLQKVHGFHSCRRSPSSYQGNNYWVNESSFMAIPSSNKLQYSFGLKDLKLFSFAVDHKLIFKIRATPFPWQVLQILTCHLKEKLFQM